MLARLAQEFVFERGKPFANNELGNFVRRDIANEAKKQLLFLPYDLKVKGSVGAGNWAAVPWLAFFDPLITESATQGFYIVYLINPVSEEIFLSLNQGTTEAYRDFGTKRGREELRRRAKSMAERIPSFSNTFDMDSIDLGSTEPLPLGYEAGHVFGRSYQADAIDTKLFYDDLNNMIAAYDELVSRNSEMPLNDPHKPSENLSVRETRQYIFSKRIERAPNVRKKIFRVKPAICEACFLNPEIHYGFSGPLEKTPLDVHHKTAISGLREGESKRYQIPEDFLVLCPTCHRMIHKQVNPDDLQELQSSLNFQHKK